MKKKQWLFIFAGLFLVFLFFGESLTIIGGSETKDFSWGEYDFTAYATPQFGAKKRADRSSETPTTVWKVLAQGDSVLELEASVRPNFRVTTRTARAKGVLVLNNIDLRKITTLELKGDFLAQTALVKFGRGVFTIGVTDGVNELILWNKNQGQAEFASKYETADFLIKKADDKFLVKDAFDERNIVGFGKLNSDKEWRLFLATRSRGNHRTPATASMSISDIILDGSSTPAPEIVMESAKVFSEPDLPDMPAIEGETISWWDSTIAFFKNIKDRFNNFVWNIF